MRNNRGNKTIQQEECLLWKWEMRQSWKIIRKWKEVTSYIEKHGKKAANTGTTQFPY